MQNHAPRRFLLAFLATALLLAAGACSPSDPLEKVRLLQDVSGDYPASLDPLRELLAERPDDPELQFRYGMALILTGDSSLAVWPLRKAMEDPEWLEKAGLPLAGALVANGSHDDAIEVATQVLEVAPESIPALLVRADARIRSRRYYEEALADAERALEIDPESGDALVPKTVALLALERVDEASVALDELESRYRDDSLGLHGSPGLCTAQATFAKEKGELALAEERYESCLETFPADSMVLKDAVTFFDGIGRAERAMEILRAALAERPEAHPLRTSIALRLRSQGKIDEAIEVLREGTGLPSPSDAAEAWAGLASFLTEEGDYDEAIAAYGEARRLYPSQSPQLEFAYADTLVVGGRLDEATRLAESMSIPAHRELVLGRIALDRGDPALALTHFSEGVRLWPNNPVARYYAAAAAEQTGDFERAIEDYRYAMRIDSEATDAHLRLGRIHNAAGRYDHALSALGFRPGARPEEESSGLLQLHILGRLGRLPSAPPPLLQRFSRPGLRGRGMAAAAEGIRERAGDAAAIAFLREQKNLDLEAPRNADALAVLVESQLRLGEGAKAAEAVSAALAKHADSAALHALHGRVLAQRGDASAARAAYERALEIDAEEMRALVGLAQLEAEAGKGDAALALYDRALAVEKQDPSTARAAAKLAQELERGSDAEARLVALLREHPYDAQGSLALAELRHARGADGERTLDLARRAVVFGGGASAKAFLELLRPDAPSAAGAGDPAEAG